MIRIRRVPTQVLGSVAVSLLLLACAGRRGPKTRAAPQDVKGVDLVMRATPGKSHAGVALPLIAVLESELERQFKLLAEPKEGFAPVYFLGFDVSEDAQLYLEARRGALFADERERQRYLDVDVRVGEPALDNSRARGGMFDGRGLGSGATLPLGEEPVAIHRALWKATHSQFQRAQAALSEVQAQEEQRVEESEDASPDFAQQKPLVQFEAAPPVNFDAVTAHWRPKIIELSRQLDAEDGCMEVGASLTMMNRVRSLVTSEGTRVQRHERFVRVSLEAQTTAADGMRLSRTKAFDATREERLPEFEELMTSAQALRKEMEALRRAPIAQPYTGPAILEGRAAAVYFHEIFGHRLEGHRQKSDREGQTFRSQLDKPVLPEFLSVVDDPLLRAIEGQDLLGHYRIDDEGVAAQRSALVQDGVLKGFLLSRSVVAPFKRSNGHGRRAPGFAVVSRQGNLIVDSSRALESAALRAALLREIKRQNKPYGLRFVDIDGGYTTTERDGPQAFKVTPKLVYRVYADGRPDELVRGVDLVGTPLSAFETIMATGDKVEVFNGFCGAESGWVPVSATSPALLLRQIEVERSVHEREKPPLMGPPSATGESGTCGKEPAA